MWKRRIRKIVYGFVIAALIPISCSIVYEYFYEWDFGVWLPNGYLLCRTSWENCSIRGRERRMAIGLPPGDDVPPNIREVAMQDEVVFGRATISKSIVQNHSVAGYFILDTRSGKAQIGLSERRWREILHDTYGIDNPKLQSRWRFFRTHLEESRKNRQEYSERFEWVSDHLEELRLPAESKCDKPSH